ncbi:MAG TPA: selenide, water dikinase SelD [Vicinamibacterales bacterium]|nr:selenide, water dikinase SelD [Vicinamibacterales bacterium]
MAELNQTRTIPLTSLSHGGGCGCKLAPGVLEQILETAGADRLVPRELLVGLGTRDDAAVYQINGEQAIVATTDFFMPIVDDPFDFGAIAATNAISDVYAMGGRPLFALALVAMPIGKLPVETIRRILDGGESACRRAGIPVAGGHSVDSVEPIYGLVVIGLIDPRRVRRNADARPGDALVLGKPLGVGIYGAAVKKQTVTGAQYRELVATTTQLNTAGMPLAALDGVHALTDVTGFGLLGHLLEVCRGSGVRATLKWNQVPLLTDAHALVEAGCVTGGSARNWQGYSGLVDLTTHGAIEQALLTDPQTSGGLLVACAPESVADVLDVFRAEGFARAAVIGRVDAGAPGVVVI